VVEALGLGEVVLPGETELEGTGLTQKATVGAGPRIVWFTFEFALPPPLSRRAAGTTRIPRMTVATKASAPHS